MSKFIKVNDRLINTDTVEEIHEDKVILKNGDVIRDSVCEAFYLMESDGRIITAHTTTLAVQPYCYEVDGVSTLELEEFPIIGWRVSDSYDTASEAVPVFQKRAGEFNFGNSNFDRFGIGNSQPFPLAIRFDGSDTIWFNGMGLSREGFISYCEAHLAKVRVNAEQAAKVRGTKIAVA